jgi:hypothetical protein
LETRWRRGGVLKREFEIEEVFGDFGPVLGEIKRNLA